MQMVCVHNYIKLLNVFILIVVICRSDFCANGGTCEVSPVGLTCRLVETVTMIMIIVQYTATSYKLYMCMFMWSWL